MGENFQRKMARAERLKALRERGWIVSLSWSGPNQGMYRSGFHASKGSFNSGQQAMTGYVYATLDEALDAALASAEAYCTAHDVGGGAGGGGTGTDTTPVDYPDPWGGGDSETPDWGGGGEIIPGGAPVAFSYRDPWTYAAGNEWGRATATAYIERPTDSWSAYWGRAWGESDVGTVFSEIMKKGWNGLSAAWQWVSSAWGASRPY